MLARLSVIRAALQSCAATASSHNVVLAEIASMVSSVMDDTSATLNRLSQKPDGEAEAGGLLTTSDGTVH